MQKKVLKKRGATKTKVKEPSALFSAMILAGLKLWLKRRVKCKITRNVGRLERPAIVLCNHGSFIDFAYFALLLSKDKPHAVTTRQYFYDKKLAWLLNKLGAIPKSMFTADLESIRGCLDVIKNDGVLVICPEARLTTAGEFEDIQPSTMSFLHKMGQHCAFYTVKFGGDYLALPKWARKGNKRFARRGSLVEAELNELFAKGESADVTLAQFEHAVNDALAYNDFDWLRAHPEVHYPQGNLAEGLQNVLYRCQECESEFTLTAHGNSLRCQHCGSVFTMDDRYAFTAGRFENLQQWYRWQMDELGKEIQADSKWKIEDGVALFHASTDGKKQLRKAGEGRCVYSREGLTYTGSDSDEQIVKTFPLAQIYRILFGAGADFEIYAGQEIWYFVPSDTRPCVKWYMASMLLCR